MLQGGDELLLDAGLGFNGESGSVQRNLENVRMDMHAEEREFMFAFQVVGVCGSIPAKCSHDMSPCVLLRLPVHASTLFQALS